MSEFIERAVSRPDIWAVDYLSLAFSGHSHYIRKDHVWYDNRHFFLCPKHLAERVGKKRQRISKLRKAYRNKKRLW